MKCASATSGNQHAPLVRHAVRGEHRDGHQHDHPARVHRGLEQLGAVEAQPVDRSRDQQVEIPRQEEARQRGDDVRQQQDREEADENHAEQLSGEQRTDLRHSAEVEEQAVTAITKTKAQKSTPMMPSSAMRAPRPRSPPRARTRAVSHFGRRRWSRATRGSGETRASESDAALSAGRASANASSLQASSTSTTARAAFSPVRRRKISSRPSSPAAASARSSPIVPHARILPP